MILNGWEIPACLYQFDYSYSWHTVAGDKENLILNHFLKSKQNYVFILDLEGFPTQLRYLLLQFF